MDRSGSSRALDDWLQRLSGLSPVEIVLGLERVNEVLGRLAPKLPPLVIHVAGTNGKGSCVAMLEALLRDAGHAVGAYTSPHLQRYNERMRVDGVDCSDAEIVTAFERVESARHDVPLTYFEFGTLAALAAFEARRVSAMVLEVGMGGRLDAVNAIEPDGGIITNVSLDHCEWLGPDIDSIAREKAGILRAGKPFVFGEPDPPAAIGRRAAELGADLLVPGRDYSLSSDAADGSWTWTGRRRRIDGLEPPALAASVQTRNAAAVLALLEALGEEQLLARERINAVLGSVTLPGRMQIVRAGRDWLLDVAHNGGAADVLAESLRNAYGGRPITAVIGLLADKDAGAIVTSLAAVVARWIAVDAASPRAVPAGDLAVVIAEICNKPCRIEHTVEAALAAADARARADELVLVCGSFYVVGPALDTLYSRRTGSLGGFGR